MNLLEVSKENFNSAVLETLEKEFRTGWNRRAYEAQQNQRAAQAFARQFPVRTVDGIGQCVLEVDTQVYNYWVSREGKDFWKDKGNINYFKRHFDEMAPNKVEKKARITKL